MVIKMSAELFETISMSAQNIIIAIIGLICAFAVYYVNKFTEKIISQSKIDLVNKYLKILNDLVVMSVETTNQTYVDSIKAMDTRNTDNSNPIVIFDKEAQKEAFEKTKNAVLTNLNSEVKDVITEFVGDFDSYVDNLIESKVNEVKKSVISNG